MRIGHGYDVHRLVEGRKLIIGGVNIPYEKGLLGHSDADVLLHAVTDAILGAAAMGDIGGMFPDSDNKYAGIDSMQLLETAYAAVKSKGYVVSNLDCTVIAQKPKLAPFIPEMRHRISVCLSVDEDAVNVKATTEEKLGFTGEGLGIAAHCVTLLKKA